MEPGYWPSEHSDALRDYFLKGMSYAEIGREINARFGTAYTRSALVGRAKRLGVAALGGVKSPSIVPSLPGEAVPVSPSRPTWRSRNLPPKSAMKPASSVKLRCVGIQPRLLSLVDLGPSDCRYPYGGDKDGEEIAFCGHARQAGSSYCAPHARLTRGPGASPGRVAGPAMLRLVFPV
ncbi:GcrA family cell cycle regulator [Bradyrhizobium sp.]|uniref:GcrA family cell cycle regulator n=1 Tax=Bradyrhizobium sp. TaxID=376 RepID=UPI0039E2D751